MNLNTNRSDGPIGYIRCLVWAVSLAVTLAVTPTMRRRAAMGSG